MKLKNTTSLDDELIREIVRQVKPAGIAGFDLQVKNTRASLKGSAWPRGCGYHATAAPLVNAYIGPAKRFPQRFKFSTGGFAIYSRIEALVFVLAHELRHLWQAKHKRGKVWGSRGQFSQRDADAYGIRMVRQWRKEH